MTFWNVTSALQESSRTCIFTGTEGEVSKVGLRYLPGASGSKGGEGEDQSGPKDICRTKKLVWTGKKQGNYTQSIKKKKLLAN